MNTRLRSQNVTLKTWELQFKRDGTLGKLICAKRMKGNKARTLARGQVNVRPEMQQGEDMDNGKGKWKDN